MEHYELGLVLSEVFVNLSISASLSLLTGFILSYVEGGKEGASPTLLLGLFYSILLYMPIIILVSTVDFLIRLVF